MISSSTERPPLTPERTGTELLRWYWLKDELAEFARLLHIRATGEKALLAQRIASHLDGCEFPEPTAIKRPNRRQLSEPLTSSTPIPAGQRCSQVLRAWFSEEIGASFHFDAEMREVFLATDGTQTLADAVNHWYQTRGQEQKPIDAQYEYNRFTRAWHSKYPTGSKSELLTAWRVYRTQPIDARGKA